MSACNAGNPGSIPGLERSPGEGNDNPLQCSCLENPMDTGAWRVTVHGVAKSRTQLSDFSHSLTFMWLFDKCLPPLSLNYSCKAHENLLKIVTLVPPCPLHM